MKALGYIGAFLGGAIAGAAIGLLAAPESGKDTRKKISSTIKDFCDKHNLELTKKEMAELAEDLVDINVAD
ncbi:MAG: YtxH domain-containing protein [Prevotella sp.]|nr:YtxH domain-containing protein [Prevotella sp.]MDE6152345.1 YtxH domain-containing protein [Prevotella sp.]